MKSSLLLFFTFISILSFAQPFKVGDKVDMYSTDGNYYAATVKEISGTKYKIHFDAYEASNDTLVESVSLVRGGRPGDKIIVVAMQGTYYGTIEQVLNTSYKVKYDGYPEQYTLTRSQFNFISPSSLTATPGKTVSATNTNINTNTNVQAVATTGAFTVGTSLQALQGKTWYAATIKEIKDEKYLVKYEGYNEEEWVTKDRLRTKATLTSDKLKATGGKTYIRSIRWIATGYTELSWYFFGDNGVVVVNPVAGTNPINYATEQKDNFKNVGYYTIGNNQVTIKWLNGTSSIIALTYRNGEIIEMDAGGIMVRQKGLADNYKLSGTFKGAISFAGAAAASTYTFTRDGKITVTKTGFTNTQDANGQSINTKSGTYRIKGNTIFLSYNDGTAENANIGIFDGSPAKMVLNNNWLTAQ